MDIQLAVIRYCVPAVIAHCNFSAGYRYAADNSVFIGIEYSPNRSVLHIDAAAYAVNKVVILIFVNISIFTLILSAVKIYRGVVYASHIAVEINGAVIKIQSTAVAPYGVGSISVVYIDMACIKRHYSAVVLDLIAAVRMTVRQIRTVIQYVYIFHPNIAGRRTFKNRAAPHIQMSTIHQQRAAVIKEYAFGLLFQIIAEDPIRYVKGGAVFNDKGIYLNYMVFAVKNDIGILINDYALISNEICVYRNLTSTRKVKIGFSVPFRLSTITLPNNSKHRGILTGYLHK